MFKRISNLFKGFLGLFIGGMERKNPEALLEVEKENLRKQIGEFNKGLATHAGLVERLLSQAKKLEAEENDLRAKTKALLTAGQREAAAENAYKLQAVDKQHDEIAKQLADAEVRYKELIRARDVSVKTARDKIDKLRRDIDDMAAGMITTIGGSGDTLSRLSDIVEDERTKAAGRARVSRDSMDLGDINLKESEQKALADMALADFAAAEGIALEPKTPATTTEAPASTGQGTMGPSISQ